jgi:hypothetical protein
MITLVVDLEDSNDAADPVCVFPGSHQLGVTSFPPSLKCREDGQWLYTDDSGNNMNIKMKIVVGELGRVAMWHACMLHGARPLIQKPARLVLRSTLLRSEDPSPCGIDIATQYQHDPKNLRTPLASGPIEDEDGFVRLKKSDFMQPSL